MDEDERYRLGMQHRREVLGDAWVDRANAGVNDFNREFQALITRFPWGEIWSRPGLDRRTRSMITLASLIALHAWDEFRLHVRASFNNGLTREELKEVILHCAAYAGIPAANSAMHHAQAVLDEIDGEAR